jgi:hypothetical protein
VHPPADVVRRLQNHQIRYPGLRQPLPRRDPCPSCTQRTCKSISLAYVQCTSYLVEELDCDQYGVVCAGTGHAGADDDDPGAGGGGEACIVC